MHLRKVVLRSDDIKFDRQGIPQEPDWMEGMQRLTEREWAKLVSWLIKNRSSVTRKRKKQIAIDHASEGSGIRIRQSHVFDEACKLAGVKKDWKQ